LHHFDTVPECDEWTDGQMERQTNRQTTRRWLRHAKHSARKNSSCTVSMCSLFMNEVPNLAQLIQDVTDYKLLFLQHQFLY